MLLVIKTNLYHTFSDRVYPKHYGLKNRFAIVQSNKSEVTAVEEIKVVSAQCASIPHQKEQLLENDNCKLFIAS